MNIGLKRRLSTHLELLTPYGVIDSSLVQEIICHLVSAIPLPKIAQIYCELDPPEHTLKMTQRSNVGHFASALMCYQALEKTTQSS